MAEYEKEKINKGVKNKREQRSWSLRKLDDYRRALARGSKHRGWLDFQSIIFSLLLASCGTIIYNLLCIVLLIFRNIKL